MPVKYENGGGAGGSILDGLGVAGRVPYFTDPDTLSISANFLWNNASNLFTVTGDIKTSRLAVGVGSAFGTDRTVDLVHTLTDLSAHAVWYGINSALTVTPAVDSAGDTIRHVNLDTTIAGANSLAGSNVLTIISNKTSSDIISTHRGVEITLNTLAGTATLCDGLLIQNSIGASAVTEARGISLFINGNAGSCSTYKALHLVTPPAFVVSSLGLHSEDQGLTNYFLHSLGGKNLLSGPMDMLTTVASSQFAFQTFSLTGLVQPFLGYDPTNYGSIEINGLNGGLSTVGLTANGSSPLTYEAIVGSITPTNPAIFYVASKADGAGGQQALAASEIALELNNGGVSNIFDLYGNGAISINAATWTAQSRLNVKAPAYIAGTGTITNGGTGTVVGVGTLFTTELSVGDKIATSGSASTIGATVLSITDNTHLTVDYPQVWAASNFVIIKPMARFTNSNNETNATIFPNGDFYGKSVHAYDAGSLIAISAAGFPKLGFGFLDPTLNHCFRTSGGSNTDLMLDVFGTIGGVAAHWFGVNGFFKTGFGASIGDTSFAVTAPVNGLYVNGPTAIGTSTPSAVAKLDVSSTTQGFLPPRMTTAQRTAIAAIEGLMVWDTDLHALYVYDNTNWVAAS